MIDRFHRVGWVRFAHDPLLGRWLGHARSAARDAVADPANAGWIRCGGTWFAGVNVLPNDETGAVAGSGPLAGEAVSFVLRHLGLAEIGWDRAQVSVVYPGYPRRDEGESDAAFGFRRLRDAAHVDGLLPSGPKRRRRIGERHGFVLGVPMTDTGPGASPLVVWEGSHQIIRKALRQALEGRNRQDWHKVDITAAYQIARKEAFDRCARVAVHARPGEAYLLHRLVLHGIGPWRENAAAPPEGRMIAYFRPEQPGPVAGWLERA